MNDLPGHLDSLHDADLQKEVRRHTLDAWAEECHPPVILFHGTIEAALEGIYRDGLSPHTPIFWAPESEMCAVYLTGSLHEASFHAESERSLLIVDVRGLDLLSVGFYTFRGMVEPRRITSLADYPELVSEHRRNFLFGKRANPESSRDHH
jgi:hypothetical protein